MPDDLEDQEIDKLAFRSELAIRRARRIAAAFHRLEEDEANILRRNAEEQEKSPDPASVELP